MNVIPAKFNPFGNLWEPLLLLLVLLVVGASIGALLGRRLPRQIESFLISVFCLLAVAAWIWLVFYRHILPGF